MVKNDQMYPSETHHTEKCENKLPAVTNSKICEKKTIMKFLV